MFITYQHFVLVSFKKKKIDYIYYYSYIFFTNMSRNQLVNNEIINNEIINNEIINDKDHNNNIENNSDNDSDTSNVFNNYAKRQL